MAKKVKVETTGNNKVQAFFEMSGLRFTKKNKHNPFIVFVPTDDSVRVDLVDSPEALLGYPASTKVMAQWPGKDRSDFFKFTVGKLRKHITDNPRHVCQVV